MHHLSLASSGSAPPRKVFLIGLLSQQSLLFPASYSSTSNRIFTNQPLLLATVVQAENHAYMLKIVAGRFPCLKLRIHPSIPPFWNTVQDLIVYPTPITIRLAELHSFSDSLAHSKKDCLRIKEKRDQIRSRPTTSRKGNANKAAKKSENFSVQII